MAGATLLLGVAALLAAPALPAWGQQAPRPERPPSMEEALSGFDAPQPAAPAAPAAPGAPAGQTPPSVEDALSGFDAPPARPPTAPPSTPLPGPPAPRPAEPAPPPAEKRGRPSTGRPAAETGRGGSLDGFARLDGSYNYAHKAPPPGATDFRGLSKLRISLQLEWTQDYTPAWKSFVSGQAFYDFAYTLNGASRYTDDVLSRQRQEAELREVWLEGTPLQALDLKAGRQIAVWGQADFVRVVDILNPIDNREPGLADIEDLRLPVTMTRLDYQVGGLGRLSAIALHEVRFNKDPPYGSDFFPGSRPLPREDKPADGGANTQYALAFQGYYSGWDLGLYWAQVFDPQAHQELLQPASSCAGPSAKLLRHSRLTMGGASGTLALGNWLLKAEAAYLQGIEFCNRPGTRFDRLDALLGFDYTGFADTTLSLEAANRHLFAFDRALKARPDGALEDVNQYALAYRGDFMNQLLQLVAVAFLVGERGQSGSLQRLSAKYFLADALSVAGGVIVYQPGSPGNPLFLKVKDNDRLFFELRYDF
ncbi:MAG: ligand-binding protein SH3 [Candidatus Lambdaproteobacteria bacterium]|nr:ligand-binding protein SH3 [Candidatus Lambdaproteobacteria bacterium]